MAKTVNPLDPLVEQIITNAAYLTPDHKAALAELLADYLRQNAEYDAGTAGKYSLKGQIEKQFQLLERMQNQALTQINMDFGDQKAVMAASKSLMEMLQKFKSEMERESREKTLEEAIKDTFHDMKDPELRVKFMNILRGKLAKNTQQKAA